MKSLFSEPVVLHIKSNCNCLITKTVYN